jgi:lipoprotein-releasing system ATP-binding protein
MNSSSSVTEQATNHLLEAIDVAKDYYDGTRVLHVLKNVNLRVKRGETISIVGSSGSGKSTLLHLLGALDHATGGRILLENRELRQMSRPELANLRNRSIGFVFQFHHLMAEFSALENVLVPGLILQRNGSQLREAAKQLLDGLGLGERLTHRPSKLSGGEQQRVSLARALINDPDLILDEEPTGNLDSESAETVIDLLWKHTKGRNKSLIIVTHEADIASRADRSFRLREGVLVPETQD